MYNIRAVLFIVTVFQLLIISLGLVCGPELTCEEGWTMSNTAPVCYLPVNVSMNWEFASLACESVGASLIKIEDETENCEIRDSFKKFWIGLSRNPKDENETVWNGKEVVSENDGIWDINQPETDGNKLKCVAANKNHLGRWSYEDCLTKLPFVCKKKSKLKGCFQCPNGNVIPPKQTCDDENDCGDNSDEMNCSSKCRYLYTGSSGNITYNPYQDMKTCQWKIVGPIGSTIKLTVKDGSNLEMNADFITIPPTLINGLTGQITEDKIFYSSSNVLRIIMNSDNSQTGPFIAHWQAENVIESWNWTAESVAKIFSLKSLPHKQYEWLITAQEKNVLTLQFEVVNLDKKGGSYLKFFDGNHPVSVSYNTGEFYVSRSKSIRIVLVSYSGYNQLSLSYYQGCEITASARQSFNIASPGFTEDNNYGYPNDVYCEWNINTTSNYPASIKFTDFNLKQNSDYLTIRNRATNFHANKGFSGDGAITNTDIFRSTDGYFMLGFTSDMVITAKGFQAQYSRDCRWQSPLSPWTKTTPILEEYTPFDTEIKVTCMTGYQFKQEEYSNHSSVSVKCMLGGNWNVTRFPDCQILYCGTPPPIDYGYILSSTGSYVNKTATYKCDDGFTIDKNKIVCQADGKWETKPKCTASDCTVPSLSSNLLYTSIDGDYGKYGNVLEFSCKPGYQLVGSLRIYCQTNGWSHETPICKEIICPIPMVTEGKIDSNSGILFGSKVNLQCNPGYIVNGTTSPTQQLTCGTDGTFTDDKDEKSELLCIGDLNTDIDECKTGSNICKANQRCVNNQGSYTCPCKDGYKPGTDPNKDCININECEENKGGCSQICTDKTPGYTCTCNPGYELYLYDGFNNISLAKGEDGKREGDVYYIDHTCVRKLCPQPVSPENGVVLSQKQLFYYEDTVEYKCNHGYKKTNGSLRICDSDGQWNLAAPMCEVARCKTQSRSDDIYINRVLPGSSVDINYGEESIIECNYGTTYINRTQYCGYTGSDTYGLLGDSSGCPEITCGQPVVVPGSSYTIPGKTTYDQAFTFKCQTGFTVEGLSTRGNYKVKCEENGRWGIGNLTCTGEKCVDPGTPGGARQVVTSYEVGELLYFKCNRDGYEPVPPEPFLCQVDDGDVKWNNTELPSCKDVTVPVFSNCPSDIIYVDYMEPVSYTIPTATDNSGVIKRTNTSIAYMKPNTVIKNDINVNYYAMDYAGNIAECLIQIKIKQRWMPTLQCASGPIGVEIKDRSFINPMIPQKTLVTSVLPSISNLTFSSVIPFTSLNESPKEIEITATDPYGTATSCSMLTFPLASACFEEAFPTTSFSQRTCTPGINGSLTCDVTCNTGYLFNDGRQKQSYQCEIADNPQPYQPLIWTPRASPNDCLPYSDPAYRVEIEVTYSISGSLSYKCTTDHDSKLKSSEFRNALASQLRNRCSSILTVNNITVEDIVIATTVGFTITSKLVSVIPSRNSVASTTYCVGTLKFQLQSGAFNSYLGYNSPLNCSGITASANVTSAKVSNSGNLCPSGSLEKSTDLGTKCVSCPLGSYFFNNSCVDCPRGEYQDVAGQLQCKTCVAGKTPSDDKTTCIGLCPKGFINKTNGQLPFCVPCPEDTYWLNSTYCQTCPSGYKTFSTAAKNISDCRAPCSEGNYSTTGYEPCMPCPLNYYQDKKGQKTCISCETNEVTENTGSINSSFCIDKTSVFCNASEMQCNGKGDCSVIGHIKYCSCYVGYKGDNCEYEDNPCDAKPCFNGGNCIKTSVDTYNCLCPIDDSCSMHRESGNHIGKDGDEYSIKTLSSVEACEKECVDDTRCKAVAFISGICIFYVVNTVAIQSPTTSTLSRKVCEFTVLFTGDQCETDAINSCANNTKCGSYGMCQDGLGTIVYGKIQSLSTFKCLCQRVGDFTADRCERKANLCLPNPCGSNGKCVSFGDLRYHCECLPGYTGESCSTNIDECKIHPNGCLYGGECKDGINTYTCVCKPGFYGDHCQTAADFCTLDSHCTNGLCYNNYDNYTAVCVCKKPYQLGSNGKCVLMDPCSDVTCRNGTCKNGECECQTGYEGSQCQHDIDDCKSEPCKNGAQCIDRYNSFECKCKPGYDGVLCDKNVDDCYNSCICVTGYTGKNCSEEINECNSYPCKHGSQCIDLIGDYKCNCTPGWTGKDCGTPVNYCKNDPCKNGGNCYNLIDGFFCRCKPGTRGDTCDVFPRVCNVTTPCTKNGACWDSDGTAVCNCTGNYTGKSCHLIKDSCKEEVCKNGGTCRITDLGFQCECPRGYSGAICEVYTGPCSVSPKCHSTAMCKSENDKFLCLCTEGRTLTDSGCKVTYEDWDMFFDSKIGGAGSLSLTPFMFGTKEYSVAFWTRFNVNVGDPEPALIQILSSSIAKSQFQTIHVFVLFISIANPLDFPIDMNSLSKSVIFKVTFDSVYTSNGTHETTVKLEYNISDGKWHHVAVTLQSSSQIKIVIDGISKTANGVKSSRLPEYAQLLIGQNLNGRLSRVTVWKTVLTDIDIVMASANPNYNLPGILAQGWTNYMLSEGSERRYPSKVKETVCDLGLKDTFCVKTLKENPVVIKCPSDKEEVSSTRLTEVKGLLWGTDIVFNSTYSLHSIDNFPSDRLFGYGAKSYTAFVIDDYGNSAECTVRVVIKRSSNCYAPSGDYTPTYCEDSSGSICDLQCTDNTKSLSQPVPKIFKCGNLGTYYSESVCENKPYHLAVSDFVIPACGERRQMKRRIKMKLQYRFLVSCVESFVASLIAEIGTTFNSQLQDWTGICSVKNSKCDTFTVTSTCSETQVKEADVEIEVSNLSDKVTGGGASYTPLEAFKVLVFIEKKFTYPNIGASELLYNTVLIKEFTLCEPGYAIVGENCVQCPAGSYYNSLTYSCQFCPKGQYQDQEGQSSCMSCDGTKTTLQVGTSRSSDCVDKCLPGTFYEQGTGNCVECPQHHYQNEEGKAYCLGCPVGKFTSGKGSNSSSDCCGNCIDETTLKPGVSCDSCPREPGLKSSGITAVIGGVVGTVLALILIALIVFIIYRRKNNEKSRKNEDSGEVRPHHIYEDIDNTVTMSEINSYQTIRNADNESAVYVGVVDTYDDIYKIEKEEEANVYETINEKDSNDVPVEKTYVNTTVGKSEIES